MSLTKKRSVFCQIVQAVKNCHDLNIVHRDIKLNNIIINKHLKIHLIDFGYSMVIENPSNTKVIKYCGTPFYMAPEIISKEKRHDRKIYFIQRLY